MSGVNKVIILGRLGKDPENNNGAVKFSIATSEKFQDRSGQNQEKTEWHNIVAFGKLGEICLRFLAKGRMVFVEGKLSTSSYEKNGVKMFSTQIVASNVQFLSGGNSDESDSLDI